MIRKTIPAALAALLALAACESEEARPELSMATLVVPADFSYATVQAVQVDVTARWPDRSPAVGVVVMVFTDGAQPPTPDQEVARGLTGADGRWTGRVVLPARMDRVPVVASLVGVPASADAPIVDGRAVLVLQPATAEVQP